MALKTIVKVGNITNLSDARYCAGMGVDMLGFCFDEASDDFIGVDNYKDITGWVSGPKLVGEFSGSNEEYILKTIAELEFDMVQVDNIHLANSLANSYSVIYNIDPTELALGNSLSSVFQNLNDSIEYIVIDSQEKINNTEAQEVAKVYPVLRGFELDTSTALSSISEGYNGISLKGSQELKPGFKDYDELADILEILEVED
ncbi:MAG: hypothetical protein JXQ96_09890 [Cyclobacteriaceae bacterium]